MVDNTLKDIQAAVNEKTLNKTNFDKATTLLLSNKFSDALNLVYTKKSLTTEAVQLLLSIVAPLNKHKSSFHEEFFNKYKSKV
jgi:hypothetical protein